MERRETARGPVGGGRYLIAMRRQRGMVGTVIEMARKETEIVGGIDRSMLCHIRMNSLIERNLTLATLPTLRPPHPPRPSRAPQNDSVHRGRDPVLPPRTPSSWTKYRHPEDQRLSYRRPIPRDVGNHRRRHFESEPLAIPEHPAAKSRWLRRRNFAHSSCRRGYSGGSARVFCPRQLSGGLAIPIRCTSDPWL